MGDLLAELGAPGADILKCKTFITLTKIDIFTRDQDSVIYT